MEGALKEHGIMFSAPMVLALLAGRKTQTRRLATSPLNRAEIGDRLWVRETWSLWSSGHDAEISYPADCNNRRWQTGPNTGKIPDASLASYFKLVDKSVEQKKRINVPAIHMPRWASRITLEVTGKRTEWLQDISEEDAIAEGVVRHEVTSEPCWNVPGIATAQAPNPTLSWESARDSYFKLWKHLHGDVPQLGPKVLVLEFRRING